MNEQEFKQRTKRLALAAIQLVDSLPKTRVADVIGRQLVRYSTSVGSNYRSACRGNSKADMIAKLSIVEEEADESVYWLELLVESGLAPAARIKEISREANEIVAMTVASTRTLRTRVRVHEA
jgi:four helix bundle protein